MSDGPSLMDDKEATRLRLELRRIPRTPIRSVQADELVKVRGFVALEGSAVPAPVTGTPCAIYCVDAKLVQRSLEWTGWTEEKRHQFESLTGPTFEESFNVWPGWQSSPLPRETGGRDLVLDDGQGRAQVRIEHAQLSLLGNWRTSLATNRTHFLSRRSLRARDHNTELEYRELTVVPGEILTVFGRAVYEADPDPPPSGPHPYRAVPLRSVFAAGPASPLYIVQEHVVALDAVG